MAGGMTGALRSAGAALVGAAWEVRRRAYARGLLRPERVGARVVSVGNITVGGTGKTTLVLWLARRALERGHEPAVVCRRYRPGPGGWGDEELMYRGGLGERRVFAGDNKRESARAAAGAGARLLLVDDGFSHWGLARSLDIVLLDARDLLGGGRLLPAGRLREPLRALQRARVVVVSRLAPGEDAVPLLEQAREHAPGAVMAAGRHRVTGVRALEGAGPGPGARVRVVTGTGNPAAVAASAREAGFEVTEVSAYRDHHWFAAAEVRSEQERSRAAEAWLLLTEKDAVRWPAGAGAGVAVLEVEWGWVAGGEAVERLTLEGEEA